MNTAGIRKPTRDNVNEGMASKKLRDRSASFRLHLVELESSNRTVISVSNRKAKLLRKLCLNRKINRPLGFNAKTLLNAEQESYSGLYV